MKIIKEIKNVLDFVLTSDQCIILNSEENQIEILDNDFNKLGWIKSVEKQNQFFLVKANKLAVKDRNAQYSF